MNVIPYSQIKNKKRFAKRYLVTLVSKTLEKSTFYSLTNNFSSPSFQVKALKSFTGPFILQSQEKSHITHTSLVKEELQKYFTMASATFAQRLAMNANTGFALNKEVGTAKHGS